MSELGFNSANGAKNISNSNVEGGNGLEGVSKLSVMVRCTICQKENFSRVESKVSSNGKVWAILCCCLGSWLLSLLVLWMEGFKEFHHYCPACNSMIATYKPKFSPALIGLLVLLTVGVIALQITLIILYVVPTVQQISNLSGHY